MKKLEPILRKHFKKLARIEKRDQADAIHAYDRLVSQAIGLIIDYLSGPDGAIRQPAERLSLLRSRRVMADARAAGIIIPAFDEIHRLTIAEALRAELRIIQARQANTAETIIMESLSEQAEGLWAALAEHLSVARMKLTAEEIEALIHDDEYPIGPTLQNNHGAIADRVSLQIWQSRAQGKDAITIANEAAAYMRKTTREAFSAVEYYEDTRIASEVAMEALEGVGEEYFRTRCIHDGKACQTCLRIEEEQETNPVRLSEKAIGKNAPPFHPYCRCWIEVA